MFALVEVAATVNFMQNSVSTELKKCHYLKIVLHTVVNSYFFLEASIAISRTHSFISVVKFCDSCSFSAVTENRWF